MRATLPEGALSSEPTAVPLYAGGRLLVAFTGVAPGRAPAIVVARLGPLGRVLLRTTIATGGVLDDAASAVTDARVALTWSVPRAAGGVDAFATWWTPEATFDPTQLASPARPTSPAAASWSSTSSTRSASAASCRPGGRADRRVGGADR